MKMFIGIGMLPLAWAVSISTYSLYQSSLETNLSSGWSAWALPIGFLVWVALFYFLPRPFRTYVLGHELTHALWALMMGGRVGKIKVEKKGGHVELSKTNFLITLAPYFFPFYAAVVIAAYYLAGLWINLEAYRSWWLIALGLTWSFHITFTIHMLSQCQPDIQEHGRLFSYTTIYIMNILAIALLIVLLGNLHFLTLIEHLKLDTSNSYSYTGQAVERFWICCVKLLTR